MERTVACILCRLIMLKSEDGGAAVGSFLVRVFAPLLQTELVYGCHLCTRRQRIRWHAMPVDIFPQLLLS